MKLEHFITAKQARENGGEITYDRVIDFLIELNSNIKAASSSGCTSLKTSSFWKDTQLPIIFNEEETEKIIVFLKDKGYEVTVNTIGNNIRTFIVSW